MIGGGLQVCGCECVRGNWTGTGQVLVRYCGGVRYRSARHGSVVGNWWGIAGGSALAHAACAARQNEDQISTIRRPGHGNERT